LRVLDEILTVLRNGEWRDKEKVARQVGLDDFRASLSFWFLAEFGFIEVEGGNVKLSSEFLAFFHNNNNGTSTQIHS